MGRGCIVSCKSVELTSAAGRRRDAWSSSPIFFAVDISPWKINKKYVKKNGLKGCKCGGSKCAKQRASFFFLGKMSSASWPPRWPAHVLFNRRSIGLCLIAWFVLLLRDTKYFPLNRARTLLNGIYLPARNTGNYINRISPCHRR